jgi:nicotinamide mononucleotide transporter
VRSNLGWLGVIAAGTLLWGYGMASLTDAAVPYGDAFTTVASLVAMWLQARKLLESWGYWIAVDVVAIVIYQSKGLLLTAGLYVAFLVLCIAGLRAWWRDRAAPAGPETIPAAG